MTRICFLTSADMMKDRPGAREDWFEFDLEFGALSKACEAAGISLEACIWDQDFDASVYDGFMVGTVWDYPPKQELFLNTLDRLNAIAPVWNSPALVRWNIEKTYLRELEDAGAPSIPTLWADKADEASIAEGFKRFGGDKIVVKPLVGGGAWRQALIKKGEPLPSADALPPGRCLIQPFLPGVPAEGEYSMIFFGDRFSHALNKRPKSGDYRFSPCMVRPKCAGSLTRPISPWLGRCWTRRVKSLAKRRSSMRAWTWCAAWMAVWR